MDSSSLNDLAGDRVNKFGINDSSQLQLKQKVPSDTHRKRSSSKQATSSQSSSRKLDSSTSPTKEFDLKRCASNLLQKIYKHQDYNLWRAEKDSFLKGIKSSFEEFFERVNEQLDRIINQHELFTIFEKHKINLRTISQKGNASLDEELNFFKNQCCSGKLEKEIQILEQSKSLKQNILVDFYADITQTIDNLKKTDLVLLEKLKQPDQIIRHELRRDPQTESGSMSSIQNKLKLKPLDIPLSIQEKTRLQSDSQKSIFHDSSKNKNLILANSQLNSPTSLSPTKHKSPSVRTRYRNNTASPCYTPLSPQIQNLPSGFQMQNSPRLFNSSAYQNQSQHCFQGKKIYNFEFSLEETQSVLLKNENELILIGEQIKIWDNQKRKITYEKKIEQVHELHGKKYSIGWGQFSVLDNKHVVIGNNNTRQIFLFTINPFCLIQVLEDDFYHNNSSGSASPLISPPPLNNNIGQQLNALNLNAALSHHLNFDALIPDNVLVDQFPQQNQHNFYFDFENGENQQEQSSRSYGHFVKVDENIMACSSSNNKIQVWNIKTHQLIHQMKACSSHSKINRLIKIDNQTIASHCENDNRIRLWNCFTGKQKRKSILLPTKMIQNMWTFRSFLYIVSFKNTIYVHNLNSLKLIKYLQLPFQIVLSKQFSEDYLVGVQNYNEVFILNLKDFSFKKVIKMEFQITDIIIFNSRVFATFNICSESRKGKIEYLS